MYSKCEVKILSAKCKSSFAQTCESGPKIGEACQWVFQAPEKNRHKNVSQEWQALILFFPIVMKTK